MSCTVCASANQVEFPAEIAIHFSGKMNQNRPHVFAFQKLLVCLDCGFSSFTVPEAELRVLRDGSIRPTHRKAV